MYVLPQALESEWVVTMGGARPVDLGAAARVANALARERKFKRMAHAVIALNRFGGMSQVRPAHALPAPCPSCHNSLVLFLCSKLCFLLAVVEMRKHLSLSTPTDARCNLLNNPVHRNPHHSLVICTGACYFDVLGSERICRSVAILQRRSSGVSGEVDVDWTVEKSKHRSPNAVAPIVGGGGAELAEESSQISEGGGRARGAGGELALPPGESLTCVPMPPEGAVPV